MVMAAKKKPEKSDSPAKRGSARRLDAEFEAAAVPLLKQKRWDLTMLANEAVREYLERRGFWPPPPPEPGCQSVKNPES